MPKKHPFRKTKKSKILEKLAFGCCAFNNLQHVQEPVTKFSDTTDHQTSEDTCYHQTDVFTEYVRDIPHKSAITLNPESSDESTASKTNCVKKQEFLPIIPMQLNPACEDWNIEDIAFANEILKNIIPEYAKTARNIQVSSTTSFDGQTTVRCIKIGFTVNPGIVSQNKPSWKERGQARLNTSNTAITYVQDIPFATSQQKDIYLGRMPSSSDSVSTNENSKISISYTSLDVKDSPKYNEQSEQLKTTTKGISVQLKDKDFHNPSATAIQNNFETIDSEVSATSNTRSQTVIKSSSSESEVEIEKGTSEIVLINTVVVPHQHETSGIRMVSDDDSELTFLERQELDPGALVSTKTSSSVSTEDDNVGRNQINVLSETAISTEGEVGAFTRSQQIKSSKDTLLGAKTTSIGSHYERGSSSSRTAPIDKHVARESSKEGTNVIKDSHTEDIERINLKHPKKEKSEIIQPDNYPALHFSEKSSECIADKGVTRFTDKTERKHEENMVVSKPIEILSKEKSLDQENKAGGLEEKTSKYSSTDLAGEKFDSYKEQHLNASRGSIPSFREVDHVGSNANKEVSFMIIRPPAKTKTKSTLAETENETGQSVINKDSLNETGKTDSMAEGIMNKLHTTSRETVAGEQLKELQEDAEKSVDETLFPGASKIKYQKSSDGTETSKNAEHLKYENTDLKILSTRDGDTKTDTDGRGGVATQDVSSKSSDISLSELLKGTSGIVLDFDMFPPLYRLRESTDSSVAEDIHQGPVSPGATKVEENQEKVGPIKSSEISLDELLKGTSGIVLDFGVFPPVYRLRESTDSSVPEDIYWQPTTNQAQAKTTEERDEKAISIASKKLLPEATSTPAEELGGSHKQKDELEVPTFIVVPLEPDGTDKREASCILSEKSASKPAITSSKSLEKPAIPSTPLLRVAENCVQMDDNIEYIASRSFFSSQKLNRMVLHIRDSLPRSTADQPVFILLPPATDTSADGRKAEMERNKSKTDKTIKGQSPIQAKKWTIIDKQINAISQYTKEPIKASHLASHVMHSALQPIVDDPLYVFSPVVIGSSCKVVKCPKEEQIAKTKRNVEIISSSRLPEYTSLLVEAEETVCAPKTEKVTVVVAPPLSGKVLTQQIKEATNASLKLLCPQTAVPVTKKSSKRHSNVVDSENIRYQAVTERQKEITSLPLRMKAIELFESKTSVTGGDSRTNKDNLAKVAKEDFLSSSRESYNSEKFRKTRSKKTDYRNDETIDENSINSKDKYSERRSVNKPIKTYKEVGTQTSSTKIFSPEPSGICRIKIIHKHVAELHQMKSQFSQFKSQPSFTELVKSPFYISQK